MGWVRKYPAEGYGKAKVDAALEMMMGAMCMARKLPDGVLNKAKVTIHPSEIQFIWENDEHYVEMGFIGSSLMSGIWRDKRLDKYKGWDDIAPKDQLPQDIIDAIKLATESPTHEAP